MSFNPYADNPLEASAEARGLNWRWLYLNALGVLPEHVSPYIMDVADTLYRLIGPDPARVRSALRLQELVERAAAGVPLGDDVLPAGVSITPPIGDDPNWRANCSHGSVRGRGDTLAEAVEAALEELGDE